MAPPPASSLANSSSAEAASGIGSTKNHSRPARKRGAGHVGFHCGIINLPEKASPTEFLDSSAAGISDKSVCSRCVRPVAAALNVCGINLVRVGWRADTLFAAAADMSPEPLNERARQASKIASQPEDYKILRGM